MDRHCRLCLRDLSGGVVTKGQSPPLFGVSCFSGEAKADPFGIQAELAKKIHVYRAARMSVEDIAGCTGLTPAAARGFLMTAALP